MSDTLGSAVLELTADNSKMNADIDRAHTGLQGKLESVGKALTTTGAGMTAGLTVPIVAFGKASLDVTADFESKMNVLQVATGGANISLDDLRGTALKVGADVDLVGVSASQAGESMTAFYKAGLTTNEIFGDMQGYLAGTAPLSGALRAAIDLQAASELDLAAASDVVTIAMKTFGLGADEAQSIANNFVQTADGSVASVQDLADAMVNVGPTMASFGYGLEDTNTALAILSTRGIIGAEAGTALKSMMTNLMRPTDKVNETLAMLNVKLYDQEGHLKTLPTLIGELGAGMSTLTEEQRNQAVQTLAGTYGMKAMNTLLAEGTVGWNEMEGAIADAATAQESAAARTQGLQAAQEQLQGALETLQITALTPLMQNTLTPLVKTLTEWINKLSEADPKLINMGLAILGVLAVAGPLLIMLGMMLPAIGVLLGPVGLVILAVAALAYAFVTLSGGVGPAIGNLKSLGEGIYAGVQVALEKLRAFWDWLWPYLNNVFQGTVGKLLGWITANLPLIQVTFERILGAVRAAWEFLWPYLQTILVGVLEQIKLVIQIALDYILGLIRVVMLLINGDWEGAWEEVKATALRVWEGMKALIANTLDTILRLMGSSMATIKEDWEKVWTAIKKWLSDRWDDMKLATENALKEIKRWIDTKLAEIKTWWETTWTGIKTFLETKWAEMKKAIEDKLKEIVQAANDKAQELWEAFTAPFRRAYDSLFGEDGTFTNLLAGAKQIIADIKQAWANAKQSIIDAMLAPFTAARDAIKNIYDTVKRWFDSIINWRNQAGSGAGAGQDASNFTASSVPFNVGVPTSALGGVLANSTVSNTGVTNYNVTAIYRNTESEADLRSTLVGLQMLGA